MIDINDAESIVRAALQMAVGGVLPGASKLETDKWISAHIFKIKDLADKDWLEKRVTLTLSLIIHEWVIRYRVNGHSISFLLLREVTHGGKLIRDQLGEGELKWDGCMNFKLGTNGLYIHLCGAEDTALIDKLLGEVYLLGPSMGNWDA